MMKMKRGVGKSDEEVWMHLEQQDNNVRRGVIKLLV